MKKSIYEKLEENTFYSPDGCWYWIGSYNRNGYGRIGIGKSTIGAHRVSYAHHKGTIPDGLYVCHACDNPMCINPDHLWLGTNADNQLDFYRKGRNINTRRGERHQNSKLNKEQVLVIRELHGKSSMRGMARTFNVSEGLIRMIVRRKIWKHV